MNDSPITNALTWREIDGLWYLAVMKYGRMCNVYGPFDEQEAVHAGWIWGVPFEETARE
jgi:hypothetical protein